MTPRDTAELLQQLSARMPLRRLRVATIARTLELTTAADIDQLIDRISEEEFRVDERLPYWAELWHSGVALANRLERHPELVRDQPIVELGCGLGLPGIIAGLCGARSVTFTDFDDTALLAAELNARMLLPDALLEFLALDFRRPPRRQWPVILCADVIYERRFIDPLVLCLDACLSPEGTVLLAEPNRLIAVPFFERLTGRGFRYERSSERTELHGRAVDISVYRISRRSA